MIVGVSGRKQNGKDTFSEYFVDKHKSFKIVHFADELKRMASEIFDIEMKHFVDPELKEVKFDTSIIMDNYIEKMREVTGENLLRRAHIATSPRELMQFFGTEYVRSVSTYYWIDRLIKTVSSGGDYTVSDCRFFNEAEALKKAGAKIVKVTMIGKEFNNSDHSSEVDVDRIVPDYDVLNKFGEMDLLNKEVDNFYHNYL